MTAPRLSVAYAVPTAERRLHIVVRVGAERFAFPVSHIEEALDAPAIESVPVSPDGMLGQLMHRGRMVSAWDAGWVFRLANRASGGAAIVLRDGPRRIALVVDDVIEMARIDGFDVHPVPGGADLDGVLSGLFLRRHFGAANADGFLVNVVRVEALAALVSTRGPILDRGIT